uniref:Uncharacterized protein n=1 Tax=Rhizochromulina marina TaxID=1034831 RepID=A0A7S2WAE4_9STRA
MDAKGVLQVVRKIGCSDKLVAQDGETTRPGERFLTLRAGEVKVAQRWLDGFFSIGVVTSKDKPPPRVGLVRRSLSLASTLSPPTLPLRWTFSAETAQRISAAGVARGATVVPLSLPKTVVPLRIQPLAMEIEEALFRDPEHIRPLVRCIYTHATGKWARPCGAAMAILLTQAAGGFNPPEDEATAFRCAEAWLEVLFESEAGLTPAKESRPTPTIASKPSSMVFRAESATSVCAANTLRFILQTSGLMKSMLEATVSNIRDDPDSFNVGAGLMGVGEDKLDPRLGLRGSAAAPVLPLSPLAADTNFSGGASGFRNMMRCAQKCNQMVKRFHSVLVPDEARDQGGDVDSDEDEDEHGKLQAGAAEVAGDEKKQAPSGNLQSPETLEGEEPMTPGRDSLAVIRAQDLHKQGVISDQELQTLVHKDSLFHMSQQASVGDTASPHPPQPEDRAARQVLEHEQAAAHGAALTRLFTAVALRTSRKADRLWAAFQNPSMGEGGAVSTSKAASPAIALASTTPQPSVSTSSSTPSTPLSLPEPRAASPAPPQQEDEYFFAFMGGSLVLRVLGPAILAPLSWGAVRSPRDAFSATDAAVGEAMQRYKDAILDARASALAVISHFLFQHLSGPGAAGSSLTPRNRGRSVDIQARAPALTNIDKALWNKVGVLKAGVPLKVATTGIERFTMFLQFSGADLGDATRTAFADNQVRSGCVTVVRILQKMANRVPKAENVTTEPGGASRIGGTEYEKQLQRGSLFLRSLMFQMGNYQAEVLRRGAENSSAETDQEVWV